MMVDHWSILGLEEPTQDVSSIRRAYAVKTRECHPEEDPEGFLRLREAYQAALTYAQQGDAAPAGQPEPEPGQLPEGTGELGGGKGWTLAEEPEDGPDPFEDGEAIRQFLELYTGKQRRDSKRWLDYFTCAAFLDAAREARFTRLLLDHVTRLEGEWPVDREFLNWLCVAYQFVGKKLVYRDPDGSDRVEFQFQLYRGAQFDGLEAVLEIACPSRPGTTSWPSSPASSNIGIWWVWPRPESGTRRRWGRTAGSSAATPPATSPTNASSARTWTTNGIPPACGC